MPAIQSTYRVQLSARFPFGAALAAVPYLADLGVSHLYASPLLRARAGSPHGYDVVDPTEVSPELGGEAGLRRLVAALRDHGMGLVADLVPNHMAASHENPWWVDVLRHGPASPHARVFDVDWAAGGGRVRLPVLAAPLERVAEQVRMEGGWVRYHEHRFPLAPGSHRLDQQHYELVEWRRAAVDGNYRRFFTVNDLVGVRQEDPEVFRLTHATTLRLVAEGLLDGVRVDHVDGLADPAGYLAALATAGVPWVVVEKILETGERLPSWPVAGTTGYDFLAAADGLLVDAAAAGPFTERYVVLSGRDPNAAALATRCKRGQLHRAFGAEVAAVDRHLPGEAGTPAGLAAVVELAAQLPVYRTYVTDRVGADDRALLAAAAGAVAERLWDGPPVDPGALGRLLRALLLERAAPEAVRRFQQLTGPAMAKGVEDGALYLDVRLVARNEVGGDLTRFGRDVADFHAACAAQETRWPRGLLATSTHDTKRGEDVRARLAALTDDPERWWALAERWTARLAHPVDPGDALLLWQTMVGAWPLPQDRCLAYMEKALREGGLHSSWTDPDRAYEAAVRELVGRAYADRALRAELEALLEDVAPAGRVRAAGLALLRLTASGVPDTYQGTETEQLVLVDPDNRRPVAFRGDGSLKFRLTRTALRLRRERPELFRGYRPLRAPDHLVAYARGGDRLAVVVGRLPRPPGTATVTLPTGRWRELLAGDAVAGGPVPVAELLAATPHALLVREDDQPPSTG